MSTWISSAHASKPAQRRKLRDFGFYLPVVYKRSGHPESARMARLLWRGLNLSHKNGRFASVSVWWENGTLRARAIYVDIFAGRYTFKDLAC